MCRRGLAFILAGLCVLLGNVDIPVDAYDVLSFIIDVVLALVGYTLMIVGLLVMGRARAAFTWAIPLAATVLAINLLTVVLWRVLWVPWEAYLAQWLCSTLLWCRLGGGMETLLRAQRMRREVRAGKLRLIRRCVFWSYAVPLVKTLFYWLCKKAYADLLFTWMLLVWPVTFVFTAWFMACVWDTRRSLKKARPPRRA